MTDTPATPDSQQPRVTSDYVLAGDQPTNWYLSTLWLFAILSGIGAAVFYIMGAVEANSSDYSGVPTDALAASWSFQIATGLVVLFAVTLTAVLAIGAVRWRPKA